MTKMPHNGSDLPFRFAAFDIDGTLKGFDIRGKKAVSQANLTAVAGLGKRGIIRFTATGRIESQTLPWHKLAEMDGPMVCSDGALVRFPRGRIISEAAIPQGIVRNLLVWLAERNITTLSHIGNGGGIPGGIYISYQNLWTRDMDRHREELGHKLYHCNAQDLLEAPNYKVLCAAPLERIKVIEAEARREFGDSVQFFCHGNEMFEFRALHVNKVFGLKAVADYYGADASQFMAFGDGSNDVEMLGWAGLGVAMYHGSAVAKAAAKLVVSSPSASVDLAYGIGGAIQTMEVKGS
jgi:hypothetical protein